MTYYLRNGNSFRVTDEVNIDIHKSLPVGNYVIKQDPFGNMFLEQVDSFVSPNKIYGDTSRNVERILKTYLDRTNSTGVMLAGEKGSGKTLLSKEISNAAAKLEIPTIIINTPWHGDAFNTLIQDINQPCIILFDEFEKVYDKDEQEAILTLLDGVFPSKKLFILTCNDKWRIDSHMRNRPGRIFYMLDFKGLDVSFIEEYCNDNLRNKSHIKTLCNISTVFAEFNFDMLKAIVEEMNRYNESPQDAMRMLNTKPEFSERVTYDLQLVVNNIVVPDDKIHNNTWSGNPVYNDISISYLEHKDPSDKDSEEWVDINYSPTDLVKIDPTSGKFIFANKKSTLTLAKQVAKTYDYFGVF